VTEILGEIVWLMTQDPAGREMKVAEIEALVIPAILERRFHIQYARIPVANGQAERLQPFTAEIYAVKDGGKSRLLLAKYSLPMRSNTERIES